MGENDLGGRGRESRPLSPSPAPRDRESNRPPRLRECLPALLLTALIVAVVAGAAGLGWLSSPENFSYDVWHQLAGERRPPGNIVIVAVDDETLEEYRDDPLVCWTPHFARGLKTLGQVGARIIGLDYLYRISIASWLQKQGFADSQGARAFDAPFKEQLASGRVVMAANLKEKKIELPLEDYFRTLPRGVLDVGLVNLSADPDGVVRRFSLALADDRGEAFLTFARLLSLRAAGGDPAAELQRLRQDPALLGHGQDVSHLPRIAFAGPPETFPRLSFRKLLHPDAARDPEVLALKDRIVIVAHEPSSSQDFHPTPYTRSFLHLTGQEMSGAEVHANIVATLLRGRFPRPVPGYLGFLWLALVTAGGAALFYRWPPWRGLAAGLGLCLLAGLSSFLLFGRDWLLPTVPVQLGLLLGYVSLLGLKLTGEERQRRRLRHLFGRYVADEVVEKLLASGTQPDLDGEALEVTVLFADIRGFTTMAEGLDPRQVVAMLNAYFTRICEPILALGGTVDKFMGDGVMAVFGAPVPYPDHARRAVHAALDIATAAREFRTWMTQNFGDRPFPEFRIGIGLDTGVAIVGSIGSPRRLDYTAIGDIVNTASRLEGQTKELGWTIVASDATIKAAVPPVATRGRATVQVRGRREPVNVWEPTGLNPE